MLLLMDRYLLPLCLNSLIILGNRYLLPLLLNTTIVLKERYLLPECLKAMIILKDSGTHAGGVLLVPIYRGEAALLWSLQLQHMILPAMWCKASGIQLGWDLLEPNCLYTGYTPYHFCGGRSASVLGMG